MEYILQMDGRWFLALEFYLASDFRKENLSVSEFLLACFRMR
jgi:hypothetical protein